jgi:hypothetical protein
MSATGVREKERRSSVRALRLAGARPYVLCSIQSMMEMKSSTCMV